MTNNWFSHNSKPQWQQQESTVSHSSHGNRRHPRGHGQKCHVQDTQSGLSTLAKPQLEPQCPNLSAALPKMQSIWRGTRGEGGEKVRDPGNVILSKRLEGFSLSVENENMLRKVARIFFMMQEKRRSKEESNRIFYVPCGGNMGEQNKNRC